LVKVTAVSLNYRDKLAIESGAGLPLAFPFTPCSDLAGIVVALGEGATRFEVGDRVISTFWPGWIDGALLGGDARTPPYQTLDGVYASVLAENVGFPEHWFVRAPALMLKNLTIQGIGVGHRRALEDLVAAVDRTGLKPVIDARYPLAALPDSLDHLDRGGFGRIVVELA
jgi:NADPH:quinone reductase-like Zn-dependent oxidoreductase